MEVYFTNLLNGTDDSLLHYNSYYDKDGNFTVTSNITNMDFYTTASVPAYSLNDLTTAGNCSWTAENYFPNYCPLQLAKKSIFRFFGNSSKDISELERIWKRIKENDSVSKEEKKSIMRNLVLSVAMREKFLLENEEFLEESFFKFPGTSSFEKYNKKSCYKGLKVLLGLKK